MEEIKKIDFDSLCVRAYQNAVKHGFHEQEHPDYHYMMLFVTELSEAVNADRIGKYANRTMFEKNVDTPQPNPESHWIFCYEVFIKDTVEDEFADAAIRILDIVGLNKSRINESLFTEAAYLELSEELKGHSLTEILFCIILSLGNEDTGHAGSILYYLFAVAYHLGIDLLWHIEQKMKYNEMRPYKHGGKKY